MTELDRGSAMDGGLMSDEESNVQITCFSDESDATALHFQIIRLEKQVFIFSK